MSAIGMAHGPSFESRPRIISAHADYRRTDFQFARTQSNEMRATPWERRMKPLHSWSEIGSYAAALCIGTLLASAFI